MTQAPTPGPLSGDDVNRECKACGAFKAERDAACTFCGLAPTAPVEASGLEREHGPKCWGKTSISDEMMYCYCGSTDSPSGETREALGGQKGDSETLRVLLDNLVIAQTLSKDIRQKATDEARSYLYDLRHTPQPSGETREAVRLALEDADALERVSEEADDNQWQDWAATMRQAASRIRRLALLSARPLALGGQHSSGEDAAWTWLNGHVECDPADRDYSADEMVDAFMAGAGRYDRWSKALERIAGEHQHRSGYCQTDITVEPALTAEEAQTVARDALSGTPVQSTAPVAETAGEAVAWQWRHGDDMEWHTSGVRHAWFDDEALNPRFRLRPLYAAPAPAQDDDKLRIAVEALDGAYRRWVINEGESVDVLERVGPVISALKSTAAQEGGAK